MDAAIRYDIPLETLAPGVQRFAYRLDDDFFAAFETDLLQRGSFAVAVEVERVRNQYNFVIHYDGDAGVDCDRCLAPFRLPLSGEDDMVIKYDADAPREEEDVIYVPHGTEHYNIARLLFESISVALPMSMTHDAAGLACDPGMLRYLNAHHAEGSPASDSAEDGDIPADSPWAALRGLKGQLNPN